MNDSNLKPLNTRPAKERKEIASKGGKASAAAKQQRKDFCKLLSLALDTNTADEIEGETMTLKQKSAIVLARKMADGDLKAIELGIKILGEQFSYLYDDYADL